VKQQQQRFNWAGRIYGIFRIIFCLHFQFPDEIENTKSLRERERQRDGGQWSEEKEEKEEKEEIN